MIPIKTPEIPRFDRRTLLRRAGAGALALGAGGGLVGSLASCGSSEPPEERSPRPLTGFNDDFLGLSVQGDWAATLMRVKGARATTMRQNVSWQIVQEAGPAAPYVWDQPFHDLEGLRDSAALFGLKVLPLIGTLPAWATEESVCGTRCREDRLEDFGRFVAETLLFFDRRGVVDAAEVINEPNLVGKNCISFDAFAELVTAAAEAVASYNRQGRYSKPMRVIAGGLFMWESEDPDNPGHWRTASANGTSPGSSPLCNMDSAWQLAGGISSLPNRMRWGEYFDGYNELAEGDYDVGVHIYDLSPNCDADPFAAVSAAIEKIMDQFESVKSRTSRDIWVTETGCSSRDPYGQSGQAGVLSQVAARLASEKRCRSMIVHRLYNDPIHDGGPSPCPPPSRGQSSTFYEYGVFEGSGEPREPKTAYGSLQQAWTS